MNNDLEKASDALYNRLQNKWKNPNKTLNDNSNLDDYDNKPIKPYIKGLLLLVLLFAAISYF